MSFTVGSGSGNVGEAGSRNVFTHDVIVNGDAYALIRQVPDNSVDLVVTSPPYFRQRDYGAGIGSEDDVDAYVSNLVVMFRECVRVIRDTGSVVFNVGDKYINGSLLLVPFRFALAALETGIARLVNEITWVKQNPTPRQFRRRLVSSTEPFFHFVKTDDYYYDMDAFLRSERDDLSSRRRTNVGERYFRLIAESDLTVEQKQLARASLEAVIAEVREGKIADFRMKIRGIHAAAFGGQDGGRKIQLERNGFTIIRILGNRIKRDLIESPVENVKGSIHPAVYPVRLIVEILNLLTRKGDLVLDPFMGSGSTAVACKRTERHYLGFDLNPEYCSEAERRLAAVDAPSCLF